MAENKRVKLRGDLPHATHSAEITSDGGLVIELYDFSAEAHNSFGNDVAFLLKLSSDAKDQLLSKLIEAAGPTVNDPNKDELLLRLVSERFATYNEVQDWLQKHEIPYRKESDPWA